MIFLAETFFHEAVIMFCLSLASFAQSSVDNSNCGETFSTRMDQNVFRKHRYWSRVIESSPISRPLECHINCMKNCRCLSYNICNKGKLCELNSEKKENNASLYEQNDDCDYHEYEFSKKTSSGDCLDPCCSTSSPCLNGARCQASCVKNNKRFQCEDCPDGYGGERCEIVARSCASYAKSSDKTPGLRTIIAADNTNISVFCHFTSQYAMTLVMSFSLPKSAVFRDYSLEEDFPRSESTQNWEEYRLSLAKMESIRDLGDSTHWIYTCRYPTIGVSEVDYLRVKFSEKDILTFDLKKETKCTQKLEYINIRGKSCEDCTTQIGQSPDGIFFVSSAFSLCGNFPGPDGPTCSNGFTARYFGRHNDCHDNQFGCSIDSASTTQLWFAHYLG